MSEKVEFKKEVGQAVMGNVVEAPRLSNVVTLHVGEQQKAVELITDYQRSSIKKQISELSLLTGNEEIEIYKVFIRDYGLRRFKELPRHHYQDVSSKLEQWIQQARPRDIETPLNVPMQAKPLAGDPSKQRPPLHATHPCLACAETASSFARLQRTSRFQLLGLTVCAVMCGLLLNKGQSTRVEGKQTFAEEKCYIAGNSYTIGYIFREKGSAAIECARESRNTPAVWQEVKRVR